MSTVYLALRDLQPKEFVNLASNILHLRFADSMTNADRRYWERFHIVESDAQQKREDGEFSDYRGDVRHNWDMFLNEMDQVLTEYFQALVDTMVEFGSNPKYARYAVPNPPKWAYQSLQSLYSQLETLTLQKIIPPLAERLGPAESWNSLANEFQTAIDGHRGSLLETAELKLAEWKPAEVTSDEQAQLEPKEAVRQRTPPTPKYSYPCRFRLPDLTDPPQGIPCRKVVYEIHPYLKDAIKDAWAWVDQQTANRNEVSPADIFESCPFFKHANATIEELTIYVIGRSIKTAHQASLKVMSGRTGLPVDPTIIRYIRPM
jgi:hypothetical protein